MKSASFGSTTTVLWHGWTSPDLECSGDARFNALAQDVHEIAAQTRLWISRRTPLMPHEPRRLPREASPSPESRTPAS